MGVWKYILIIVIIFIIFGAGKLPKVMEDLGRGVRLFKKGLQEDSKSKGKAKPKAKTKSVKKLAPKRRKPIKKKPNTKK